MLLTSTPCPSPIPVSTTGHGEYSEIGGTGNEKEFFDTSKQSPRMVCHFYRKATERCQIFDMHLAKLAAMHPETRFVKIDAEKQEPTLNLTHAHAHTDHHHHHHHHHHTTFTARSVM